MPLLPFVKIEMEEDGSYLLLLSRFWSRPQWWWAAAFGNFLSAILIMVCVLYRFWSYTILLLPRTQGFIIAWDPTVQCWSHTIDRFDLAWCRKRLLCTLPILLGSILGIKEAFGKLRGLAGIAVNIPGTYESGFAYHILYICGIHNKVVTVLCSAWLPAGTRKLSRLTPPRQPAIQVIE